MRGPGSAHQVHLHKLLYKVNTRCSPCRYGNKKAAARCRRCRAFSYAHRAAGDAGQNGLAEHCPSHGVLRVPPQSCFIDAKRFARTKSWNRERGTEDLSERDPFFL